MQLHQFLIILIFMAKFTLFSKVNDSSYDVRTETGGILSIFTFVLMIIVLILELKESNKRDIKMEAKPTSFLKDDELLSITYNITISYPCMLVNPGIYDFTGYYKQEASFTNYRTELDSKLNKVSNTIPDSSKNSIVNRCDECKGLNVSHCCNNCFDIIESYNNKKLLVPNLSNFTQCTRDLKDIAEGSSCNLYGVVNTRIKDGYLKFGIGESLPKPGGHKNVLSYFGTNVNLSHTIHELRFGPKHELIRNPLDGFEHIQTKEGFFNYLYTTNLIPTVNYVDSQGRLHQYSVSSKYREITKSVTKIRPEIAFKYSISPVSIALSDHGTTFSEFCCRIFALLGALFSFGSLIDSFIFNMKSYKKKE